MDPPGPPPPPDEAFIDRKADGKRPTGPASDTEADVPPGKREKQQSASASDSEAVPRRGGSSAGKKRRTLIKDQAFSRKDSKTYYSPTLGTTVPVKTPRSTAERQWLETLHQARLEEAERKRRDAYERAAAAAAAGSSTAPLPVVPPSTSKPPTALPVVEEPPPAPAAPEAPRPPDLKPFPKQRAPITLEEMRADLARGEEIARRLQKKIEKARKRVARREGSVPPAAAPASPMPPASPSLPPPPNDSLAARLRPVSLEGPLPAEPPPPPSPSPEAPPPAPAPPPPKPKDPVAAGEPIKLSKAELAALERMTPNFTDRIRRILEADPDPSLLSLPSPPRGEPGRDASSAAGGGAAPAPPTRNRLPLPLDKMRELYRDDPAEVEQLERDIMRLNPTAKINNTSQAYLEAERERLEGLRKAEAAFNERLASLSSPPAGPLPLVPSAPAAITTPPPVASIRAEPPNRKLFGDAELADVSTPVGKREKKPTPRPAVAPPKPSTLPKPPAKPVIPVVEELPTPPPAAPEAPTPPPAKTRVRVPLDEDFYPELLPDYNRTALPLLPDELPSPPLPPPSRPSAGGGAPSGGGGSGGGAPPPPGPPPRNDELSAASALAFNLPSPPTHAITIPPRGGSLPLVPEAPGLIELAGRAIGTAAGALGSIGGALLKKARGRPRKSQPPPPPPPRINDPIEIAEGRTLSPQEQRLVRMRNILLPTGGAPQGPSLGERLEALGGVPALRKPAAVAATPAALPAEPSPLVPRRREPSPPPAAEQTRPVFVTALPVEPAPPPLRKRPPPPSESGGGGGGGAANRRPPKTAARGNSTISEYSGPRSELIRTPPPISHQEFLRRAYERRMAGQTLPALPLAPAPMSVSPPPAQPPPSSTQISRSYASEWLEPEPAPPIDVRRPRVVTTTTTYL